MGEIAITEAPRMAPFPTQSAPAAAPRIGAAPPPPASADALRAKAQALEAAFLSEMLGHAGLDASAGAFGGGPGEAQFASFLRQAHAEALVARGGIGLAERLFDALKERSDVAD